MVAALFDDGTTGTAAKARVEREDVHAPTLIEIEVVHAARRLVRTAGLDADRALAGIHALADFDIHLHGHGPLLDRIWDLRDNLSAYDAAYVVLAQVLDCPLVTTDARLARAPGHEARIELLG